MTVEAYKTSEDIIQRTIGTVEKNQRYSIYKAELFPQYYSGNGIELHHPADLATTEAWFEKSFPTNQFKHKTITFWPHAKEFRSLITEAINNGYTLDQYQVMALSLWRRQEPSYNDRYEVVDIKDQRLSDLFKSENQSSPWYKETGKEIWQKSILLHTKIDTKWHIIGDEDTCYSQVGVFRSGDYLRLQDVLTREGHRQRGYAAFLIGKILNKGLKNNAKALILLADENSKAYRFYKELGFQPIGPFQCLSYDPSSAT